MVAVVTRDAVKIPQHPDGADWLVVWMGENGDLVFADSLSDIVAELLPGYADIADDAESDPHLEARVAALAASAAMCQALVLAEMQNDGVRLSEAELTAALLDKEFPVSLERWNPAEPLVLLATSYIPYTDTPRPEGSVLWLDPSNELTFLGALHTLGQGSLFTLGV